MTMHTLIVMRLADMKRVHPDQITSKCARCKETVAIYPSGQRMLKAYPDAFEVVRSICNPPGGSADLAPGALLEPFESKPKQ